MRLSYRADTENLPTDLAEELEHLVDDANILDIQPERLLPAAPAYPDVFVYRISIDKDGKQQSVSFNDMTAPESFRPLLTFLRELALQERTKGGR